MTVSNRPEPPSLPGGFTKCANVLLSDRRLEDAELRLWLLLAAHCMSGGTCYPSITRLARLMGRTYRWTGELVRNLETKGFLERECRPGKATIYKPICPTDPGSVVPTFAETPEVHFPPGRNCGSGEVGSVVPTNKINLIRGKNKNSVPSARQQSAAKGKGRKAKETDPRLKPLIDFYSSEHANAFREKPHIVGGRDSSIVKRLLTTYPQEEIERRLLAFFGDPLEWMDLPVHSLGIFEKCVQKYSNNRPETESSKCRLPGAIFQ